MRHGQQPQCARGVALNARRATKKDPEGYDAKEVRELTELMPDPQKDDLFDDIVGPSSSTVMDDDDLFGELGDLGGQRFGSRQFGGRYGGDSNDFLGDYGLGYEGAGGEYGADEQFAELSPQEMKERTRALGQLEEMYEARREWEMKQCQELAFVAHHRVMSTAKNRYVMAVRMAKIMEEIELQDHFEGEPEYWLPSWVRSYFQLDAERNALNAAQQEYEAGLEKLEKKQAEDDAYQAINRAMEVSLITNPMAQEEADNTSSSGTDEVDPLDEFLGEILPPGATSALGDDYMADILGGVDLLGDADVFDLDDDGGIDLE